MKFLFLFAIVSAGIASAQSVPALHKLPDNTVVAEFEDGAKFTMGDFKKVWESLAPAQQQAALMDRRKFLQQMAFYRKLTRMAEEAKLNEQSPYKELLEQDRMQILSQAMIKEGLDQIVVKPEEIVKVYDGDKTRFSQVKVKAIYIAFSPDGKDSLSDPQALAKATAVLAQARKGADFVQLVKENSDDETSRAKDGDFDTLRYTDNIPDAFRAALFALKKGDITEPLKQPNGYYLLRAEEITVRPLADVRDEIYNELKTAKGKDWLDRTNMAATFKVVNEEFIGAGR